uniref:NADAR domain-containing protein n=2 Tax=Emiliania huxleyi TaxID=2903 RepID=A0A6V2S337_EMIHU|mmetsp:Transcript_8600/g.24922  ORF Transcript_8600/g.24922 Transcript_8600/m.24922 type:complete len:321 (+) Transcript_8600:215-1177(+)
MAARDTAALARLCGDGVAQQLLGASGTPAAAQAPHAGGAGTAAASTGHAAGGGGADGGGGEDEDDRLQVTGHQLSTRWREMPPPQAQPVVGFYGHARGAHRSFSNFFEHAEVSCELPRCCGRAELQASGRSATLTATFGEKLIMLCKAAAMRDYASFDAIARARTPAEAKRLGRGVSPWDERLWTRVVCTVAHAIVLAKARGVPHFRAALLQTGRALIAEATSNDRHWGIGLDEGHASVQTPALWRGSNILGWALMEAREVIAGEAEAAARGGGGGEDGAGGGAGRGGVAAGQVRPAAAAGERSERRKRRAGKLQGGLWE